MASSWNPRVLLLSLLIAALSVSAFGRPCKTLFISSYSFSIKPLYPNPNSNHHPSSSSGFVAIVAEISGSSSSSSIFFDRRSFPSSVREDSSSSSIPLRLQEDDRALPFGFSSYDMSSLRDRTKDILSVVVALLFGVGCGALTAATMYLVWSLFSNRYEYGSAYEFYDDEEEDVNSPKKMGYVKIPEAKTVADE